MRLSPADDVLIRVERPLDLDSPGQLVASVLSKKCAAGATHVLVDMPVGPTAKVRSANAAAALERRLMHVGEALGMRVRVMHTDGSVPVGGAAQPGEGRALAASVLADGRAWRKFQEICEAQGGMREPPRAAFTREIPSPRSGCVIAMDNRRLARIAKLAGAPKSPCAGIELHVQHGDFVERGQPLFTLHAGSPGALAYAADYAMTQPDTLRVAEDV